ncbi:MAG: hypothetical protein RIQ93_980 [Verrucomicrobiota bacterium]|jgi:enamine deaminase RidA (YjgF/YER057c/UK114 family)
MTTDLLHRQVSPGRSTGVALSPAEFVLTETPQPGEPVADVFHRLATRLEDTDATLLSLMIYGSIDAHPLVEQALRAALGETQWPVTWIEGGSCEGEVLAGVQAFAISHHSVVRIRADDVVVGSVYQDGDARYCLLGGIGPASLGSVAAQEQETLARLQGALCSAGMELGDVVRTWFYNEDILAWYGEFNRVRSAHYAGVRWRTGSLPASTGIGARNRSGAALVLAAWAMQPLNASGSAREIASPLQCPAPAYGSSFSRAMEIRSGDWRRMLISGTASICPDGLTAWKGNARKQVELTMDVVAAILDSRGLSFRDVTRATAYFENPKFRRCFEVCCAARNLGAMPFVLVHADVCRSDLLFELELDACGPA